MIDFLVSSHMDGANPESAHPGVHRQAAVGWTQGTRGVVQSSLESTPPPEGKGFYSGAALVQSLRWVPVVDGSLRRSVGRQSGRVPPLERSIADQFQNDSRFGGRRRSTLGLISTAKSGVLGGLVPINREAVAHHLRLIIHGCGGSKGHTRKMSFGSGERDEPAWPTEREIPSLKGRERMTLV